MNINELPTNVLRDLREAGFRDERLAFISAEECFNAYLRWHGIIGFTSRLISAWEGIKKAEGTPL